MDKLIGADLVPRSYSDGIVDRERYFLASPSLDYQYLVHTDSSDLAVDLRAGISDIVLIDARTRDWPHPRRSASRIGR